MPDYLFNSSGQWIGIVSDEKHVFDPQYRWVGWLAWDDAAVADAHGQYLGTRRGDRLYRNVDEPAHPSVTAPEPGPTPEPLPRPPRMPVQTLPPGTTDVDLGL